MKKMCVLLLLAAVLTGWAGCSDDDGGAGGYVRFEMFSTEHNLSPVKFNLGHSLSGVFIFTNDDTGAVSTNNATDVPSATLYHQPEKAAASRADALTEYTVAVAFNTPVTAGSLDSVSSLDGVLLQLPGSTNGAYTNFRVMFMCSNTVYEQSGVALNVKGLRLLSGTVTVTEYGAVGGYIRGTFHGIMGTSSTSVTNYTATNGSFSFRRLADDYELFTLMK